MNESMPFGDFTENPDEGMKNVMSCPPWGAGHAPKVEV